MRKSTDVRFNVSFIHAKIRKGCHKFQIQLDDETHMLYVASIRFRLFYEKGIQCVRCGCLGSYYQVDFNGNPNPHLNLYTDQGKLMTKDHIFPRSKGGSNRLCNLQTMCTTCNNKKQDSVPNKLFTIQHFETLEAAQKAAAEGFLIEDLNA